MHGKQHMEEKHMQGEEQRRRKERKERRHAHSRWGAQRAVDDQGDGDGAMRQGRHAG